jgi:hypothetical protein
MYFELDPKVYEHFCIAGLIGNCETKQKTVNEMITNTVTNVAVSNSSSCSADGSAKQTLSLSDVNAGGDIDIGNISQDAKVTVNMNCLQRDITDVNTMRQIQNDLKNSVQQATSGFQFQPSDQETINRTENNITSNANLSSIAQCMANTFTNQDLVLSHITAKGNIKIHDLAQTAVAATASECVQEHLSKNSDVQTLQGLIDSKTTQEAKGIDLASIFNSLFGAYATMGQAAIAGSVCCIVVCILCLYFLFAGGGGSGNDGGVALAGTIPVPPPPPQM